MARCLVFHVGKRATKFITIWSGSVDAIPAGYRLCDGTGGTPDLRGRFVRGGYREEGYPGSGRDFRQRGHSHDYLGDTTEAGGHAHAFTTTSAQAGGAWSPLDPFVPASTEEHAHEVEGALVNGPSHVHHQTRVSFDWTGAEADIRPPYYALCYIQGPGEPPVGGICLYHGDWRQIPAYYLPCTWQTYYDFADPSVPQLEGYFLRGAASDADLLLEVGRDYILPDPIYHSHPTGGLLTEIGGVTLDRNPGHWHYFSGTTDPDQAPQWGSGWISPFIEYWIGLGRHAHTYTVGSTEEAAGHTHGLADPTDPARTSLSDDSTEPEDMVLLYLMRMS